MKTNKIILVLLVMFSLSLVYAEGSFYGGETSYTGSYQVIGSTATNAQFSNPNFYSSSSFISPSYYWPQYNKANCIERTDFIMQIAPGGCSPSVVRSDLLEEQDVPVFCKVMSIQVNPLIDVSKIRSLVFSKKDYPDEVKYIGYYPARAAVASKTNLVSSPIQDNLGYLVIVLKQTKAEKDMPDWISGNVTAKISYDAEGAFGIGRSYFYLNEISDDDWLRDYKEYGFWNGKGYLRAETIESDSANIIVYRDADSKQKGVNLKKGETSDDIYLSGFYCAAGMKMTLESISSPVETALIQINDEQMWVSKGDKILSGKCTVKEVDKYSGGGKISINCPVKNGNFNLKLNPGKVKLSILENNQDTEKEFQINDLVLDLNKGGIYLGYVGMDGAKKKFAVLVNDSYSENSNEFSDKKIFEAVNSIMTNKNYKSLLIDDKDKKLEKLIIESIKKSHRSSSTGQKDYIELKDSDIKILYTVLSATTSQKLSTTAQTLASNNIFDSIKFLNATLINNKEWQESETNLKNYYRQATEYYENVVSYYPNEKRINDKENSLEPYGAESLFKAASLSKYLDMNQDSQNYLNRLLNEYPQTSYAKQAQRELDLINKYDYYESRAVVNINNEEFFIQVLEFDEPNEDELGAVIMINGKEVTFGINELYSSENSQGNFQLMKVEEDKVTLTLSYLDNDKNAKTITNELEINKPILMNNNNIRLTKINLVKQVKIAIEPKVLGPKTESNFSFKIGIEKRAIELSPERTLTMIENLKKSINKWEDINKKLGEVVKGMKTACFATSAVLTVKNFVNGLSGASMARKEVMTSSGGWNDRCESLISSKKYATLQQCLLDNKEYVEADVLAYSNAIQATNTEIGKLEQGLTPVKSDFLDMDGQVNPEELRKKYYDNVFKQYYESNQNKIITLSGDNNRTLKEILPNPEQASLEDMRSIITLSGFSSSSKDNSVLNTVVNNQLGKDLTYTYEANQYLYAQNNLKSETEKTFSNKNPAILRLNGDKETYTKMDSIGDNELNIIKTANPNTAAVKTDKIINYALPVSAISETSSVTNDGSVISPLKDLGGKASLIVLKNTDGNKYDIKETYYYDNGVLKPMTEDQKNALAGYLAKNGATKFVEANSLAYENPISTTPMPKIKYFERAPYKGFPAEIPFDFQRGWYVEMEYVLSGFGVPYDESGRVANYYICNVGKNGLIEFKQNSDDICRYYNTASTADLDFPGMTSTESKNLMYRAQDAIRQASKGYGKSKITINGKVLETGISFAGDSGECTDFMSPEDCNIMFNVCDPVICPSSRCDLGGNYPVDNVIQTGIIGSLTLCLPNIKEGILIPVCISGVHAGIENYISILNSTMGCLNESLVTGRNIGICDEIKSIYLCEFFWKQAVPFFNVIIPRMIESFFQSGARGGGEYSTVEAAWDNTQSAVSYFKNEYAVNSMNAFKFRSTEEAGSEICRSFISANYPTDFENLIEPDSPVQYSAWFSEDTLTTATIPATSHYKVYYHIYAGNDQGNYYYVYLKDLPENSYIHSMETYVVDRGYIPKGGSVDQARDFTAVSGYKQLCININGQDECGFGKVSTSYALNYISDAYASKQASQADITTQQACIAGTSSLLSLAQPNIQEGIEDTLNSNVYNSGIIRVCSTYNPGRQVKTNGEYDTTNSTFDRWKAVGYCDDKSITCWLDTSSVKDVIQDKGIETSSLANVDLSIIGEIEFIDDTTSLAITNEADEFAKSITPDYNTEEVDKHINELTRVSQAASSNSFRARAMMIIGDIYAKIAKAIKDASINLEPNNIKTTQGTQTENALNAFEKECYDNNGNVQSNCDSECEIDLTYKIQGKVCCNLGCVSIITTKVTASDLKLSSSNSINTITFYEDGKSRELVINSFDEEKQEVILLSGASRQVSKDTSGNVILKFENTCGIASYFKVSFNSNTYDVIYNSALNKWMYKAGTEYKAISQIILNIGPLSEKDFDNGVKYLQEYASSFMCSSTPEALAITPVSISSSSSTQTQATAASTSSETISSKESTSNEGEVITSQLEINCEELSISLSYYRAEKWKYEKTLEFLEKVINQKCWSLDTKAYSSKDTKSFIDTLKQDNIISEEEFDDINGGWWGIGEETIKGVSDLLKNKYNDENLKEKPILIIKMINSETFIEENLCRYSYIRLGTWESLDLNSNDYDKCNILEGYRTYSQGVEKLIEKYGAVYPSDIPLKYTNAYELLDIYLIK
ncbi:MAG: tetratricopeptide repeat protein [Candidatus Nanoarchaeia archaeon]